MNFAAACFGIAAAYFSKKGAAFAAPFFVLGQASCKVLIYRV
jgi:hypothetical protein